MLLPKHTLEKMKYYTEETTENGLGFNTVITVYFNGWFRPKQKFKFKWRRGEETKPGVHRYYETETLIEFKEQLSAYCSNTFIQ